MLNDIFQIEMNRARSIIVVFAFLCTQKIKKVRCDTSSDDVSQRSQRTPIETAIFELHNLISKESDLRLTLDERIQEMRGLLYQLKSEQEGIVKRVDVMFNNIFANITGILKHDYLPVQSADQKLNLTHTELSTLIEKRLQQMNTEISSNFTSIQANNVVAFTAVSSARRNFGNEKIIFDRIITNVGGAYNNVTGVFTSPEPGVYVFSWTHLIGAGHYCHAYLYRNTTRLNLNAHSNLGGVSNMYTMTTTSGTVELTKDDNVYIQAAHCYNFHGPPYNSFSGWKL